MLPFHHRPADANGPEGPRRPLPCNHAGSRGEIPILATSNPARNPLQTTSVQPQSPPTTQSTTSAATTTTAIRYRWLLTQRVNSDRQRVGDTARVALSRHDRRWRTTSSPAGRPLLELANSARRLRQESGSIYNSSSSGFHRQRAVRWPYPPRSTTRWPRPWTPPNVDRRNRDHRARPVPAGAGLPNSVSSHTRRKPNDRRLAPRREAFRERSPEIPQPPYNKNAPRTSGGRSQFSPAVMRRVGIEPTT